MERFLAFVAVYFLHLKLSLMEVTSEDAWNPKGNAEFIALITQMTHVVVNAFSLQPFSGLPFYSGFFFFVNLASSRYKSSPLLEGLSDFDKFSSPPT